MVSPAMNTNMYHNSIVQDNLEKLRRFNYEIIAPDKGYLACGDVGDGKMGYAIAKNCMLRGANVTLVTGKTTIEPPKFVKVVQITSARERFEAVTKSYEEQDVVIKAATVADYRPKNPAEEKVKNGRRTVHRHGKNG